MGRENDYNAPAMMRFCLWEQAVLGLLALGSLALFLWGIGKKFRVIRAGGREVDRLDRIGERIGRFVREVIFQSRVVAGRPIAGFLHFLVFAGFCLFALETVAHFCMPLGFPLIERLFGSWTVHFRSAMAVVALVTGLAILLLAFRRFVLVRISPDPKSLTSGIVALFIFLLMATSLDLHGPRYLPVKVDWWLHAFLILAFPPLILHSKHFHLVMAPINIFLRNFRLGRLTVLNLDPDSVKEGEEMEMGLEKVGQLPWKLRSDFLGCVECKRCTESCPAGSIGLDLRPAGFVLAGQHALLDGKFDAPVIGTIISEQALGQCTSCMACEEACPVGIEHSQLLFGAKRAQTLALGTGGVAAEFLKRIETSGNPFASSADARNDLIGKFDIPVYEKGKTEWLLWMGCVWNYNADLRSVVESTVKVFKRAGLNFGVLASERCSGHHSRRQGEEMQYQTLARENIDAMMGAGVDRIVTGCPHCLHTIGNEYADLESRFAPRMMHHSQMIAELAAVGKLRLRGNGLIGMKATYHDPCYLGRYEKIYETPRWVAAAAGVPIAELPRSRSKSYCCGGGAAGFVRESKEGRRVDQERKDEIRNSGARLLITSCPECKMMLRGAVDETKDIAEVAAESLVD